MVTRCTVGLAWFICRLAVLPGCTPAQPTCSENQQQRISTFVNDMRLATEASARSVSIDVALPKVESEGTPDPVGGVLIVLERQGLVLRQSKDMNWRTGKSLADEVLRYQVFAEASGSPTEPVLVAAIAADVSIRDAELLLKLSDQAGFSQVAFVAEAAKGPRIPTIPEPGLTAMVQARTGADASRKAEVLSQLLAVEAERCPPLGLDTRHAPTTSLQQRAPLILGATQDALLACHCAANVDRVLSLAHLALAPQSITVLSAELPFERVVPLVAAHPDGPWSDAVLSVFHATPSM